MQATRPLLEKSDFPPICRGRLQTLQVNLGYRCNQRCLHCHVDAGPNREEMMDRDTVDAVLDFLRAHKPAALDLTGGAPEMNPHFKYLVEQAHAAGIHVMVRCNLTILLESGYELMPSFFAGHGVEVIASLPCYLEDNVDAQRGRGTYAHSIKALRLLNAQGYGVEGSGLRLNLVYNPAGASLPPPQETLEADYKRELKARSGIVFDRLLTITNMPIQRFGSTLISRGEFADYMQLLKGACQPENLASVMCRSLLSVDWQGYLYDCDFNQLLDLPLAGKSKAEAHISRYMSVDTQGLPIAVMDHCYGCTAGQGSSCGGALE